MSKQQGSEPKERRLKLPDFKLPKLRVPKTTKGKFIFFGIIVTSVIVIIGLLIGFLYLYPYRVIDISPDENSITYNKVPFFPSNITIYKDGGEWGNFDLSWNAAGQLEANFEADGIYKIVFKVGANTLEKEIEVDRTPPVISIDYPALTNEEKPLIKVSLDEDGETKIIKKSLKVNEETGGEEEIIEIEQAFTNEVEVTVIEGGNEFTIYAQDKWGNSREETFIVIADFTNPSIKLISPTYEETYDGSAEFKFEIKDKNEIEKVTVGDKEISGKDNVYSFKVDYKDGDNLVKIVAIDKAGNKSTGEKGVLKRVTAQQRINSSNSGGGGTGGSTPVAGCNNSVSGYNVFCWLNSYRSNEGKSQLSWNSSKSNFAQAYATCLETTGFSIYSNPHDPTQEVIDCMSGKGYDGTDSGRFANGAEVIAANRSTAQSYADGFKSSSTHWNIIGSSSASVGGFGAYGKWVVGYIN